MSIPPKLLLLLLAPVLAHAQSFWVLPEYDFLALLCDPATTTLSDEVYLSTCGVEKPDLTATEEEIVPPLEPEPPMETIIDSAPESPPIALALTSSKEWIPRSGSVTLSWQATGATACTASGDWSGSRPVEGSIDLHGLTEDRTYKLTCENDTETSIAWLNVHIQQAVLSWEPPTANTDGSELTLADLDGYRVYWGRSSRNYDNTLLVDDPAQTSLLLELAPGSYYFAVTAINTDGFESAFSAEGRKVIN